MGTLNSPWLPFPLTWKSAVGLLVVLLVATFVLTRTPVVKKIAAKAGV